MYTTNNFFFDWQHFFPLDEISLMQSEMRRVENALQSTESPMQIARDCLANRQRRVDSDLVQDDAENQLLKVGKEEPNQTCSVL